ncbi:low molecular weight phosphotyrosine protein phosphatase [Shewanella sp. 202IG2-18]|uniref:low molecular weight protein-tyrosine-phosphatase n=1 Tax=Parashewanella hymeniacidonis TaxID=2807618 RepID=UPI0019617600|nr:low molecular weight protein-tyrosine-phosphatase [Parashewanella hymeniacidonis]MBM7073639.1 low molecular weight phosphotyrosine protein phosphatase [Parashewanella hymeniacidonis]
MTKSINSILFVCMGNICRSPTAESVFRKVINDAGIDIQLDSAGTIGFHQGNLPDLRARAAGKKRGYSFEGITARQVTAEDFKKFDLILAADNDNLNDLKMRCPIQYKDKLKLILFYAESQETEVPDPYYGGDEGFEHVLDLLEESAKRFVISLNA